MTSETSNQTNTEDIRAQLGASTNRIRIYSIAGACLLALTIGLLLSQGQADARAPFLIFALVFAGCIGGAIVYQVNLMLKKISETAATVIYQLDISEKHVIKLKSLLADSMEKDELTGCANEAKFLAETTRHIALHKRAGLGFAILRVRIDGYDELLAELGSRGTNEMLKAFSRILFGSTREVDITARLQDENFVILLADTDTTGGVLVANRVMNLTQQLQVNHDYSSVTLSLGVTENHDSATAEQLLIESESALAHALRAGGNAVAVYDKNASATLQSVQG